MTLSKLAMLVKVTPLNPASPVKVALSKCVAVKVTPLNPASPVKVALSKLASPGKRSRKNLPPTLPIN
ncbi:MAG: hypothetical protein R3D02_13555 [Hyphomicrobiales bacterium]